MKFKSEVQLEALNNATIDTDRFLVSDSSTVKYRTGAQLLSDLGITGTYVPYTGATGNVDLGTHTLSSYNLIVNHTSGSGVAASITKGGSGEALTINKTSGSGNAMSVSGGLTSLVDLTLSSIPNATIDTDRFIVSDGGAIKYRTGAEVLSDIGGQPIGSTAFNDLIAKTGGTGTYQTSGDFRAPIFYDSNDTNFYIDPASSSSLKAIYLNGGYTQYATSIGSPSANFGNGRAYLNVWPTASGSSIMSFKIMISTTWNWAPGFGYITADVSFYFDGTNLYSATTTITSATGQARINLGIGNPIIDGGNVCVPIYSSNSNAVFAKLEGSPGFNWSVVNWGSWQSVAFPGSAIVSIPGDATVEGILQSNSSVRGPIFYDTNNTGYYLDPSSTSYISSLTVDNTINGNISGTAGSLLSYQSNWASTPTPANVVGLLGWKNYGNGHVIFDASASTTPSGTGCSNTNPQNNWSATYPTLMGWNGANTYGVRVDSARIADTATSAGSVDFNNLTNKTGGTGTYQTSGDFRAPIFYDSNNTAFYLDPSGSSVLNGTVVIKGNDNQLVIDGSTGALAAGLFFSESGVNKYELYHYSGEFRFYNYTTNQQEMSINNASGFVTARTSFRAPVFYDSNNTSYYLDAASTSNLNSIDFYALYSNRNNSSGAAVNLDNVGSSTWPILFKTYAVGNDNESGFWVGSNGYPDMRLRREDGSVRALISSWERSFTTFGLTDSTDMRAPIFYDSDNTIWYLNPTGISNVNTIYADYFIKNGGTSSQYLMADGSVTTGGGSVSWSSITGKPSNIFYYQGFTLDANTMDTNASGFTYANNAPFNGPVARFSAASGYDLWLNAPYGGGNGLAFRTKNGDTNTINPWKYPAIYGVNVNGGGDLYASIYYDQDDTSYYLNPNNTTTSLNIAGKVQINYGGAAASTLIQASGSYGTMSLNTYFGVLHTSGDFYIGLPASSGNNLYGNQARFASFIDRNNSAYYLTPSSGSNLNTGNLAGRWSYSDYLVSNNSGGLMGDYNVSGTAAKCIWTIGQSWPLANMYGLGYEYDNTYYHHLVLKNNGSTYARLAFGPEGAYFTGAVTSGTAMYSPIYYDSNDTTFYFQGSNYGDSIRCAGDIVAYYSDERLKDKKGNIENALEKVLSLNGFYYEPNEKAQAFGYKKKLEVGLSAQEVEAVLPEIIKDAPIGHGYKTLDYGKLTPLLIEAIKEQQQQINDLKELVNKLINK